MEVDFIDKVRNIVLSHIHDENFDIKILASEIGYSRSYIYRKVKLSTGKSVNEFIKGIRLNEAIKIIKDDKFTFAEVAYKVGFHSPSYFNKCFRDHYGLTPGEYKNLNPVEILPIELAHKKAIINKLQKVKSFHLIVILSFLLFVGYHYVVNGINKKELINSHTIAVLPFDDFSKDSDTEWFCNGLTDDIILHLSKEEGFQVSPRHSTIQYRDSHKTILEIANELNVNLVLEGSVRAENDSIRIIVTLNNDTSDYTIWTNDYHEKFNNTLNISTTLARNIVDEIKLFLNSENNTSINDLPMNKLETDNSN